MVLRECRHGAVYMPSGQVKYPVEVKLGKEDIVLYFHGYRFQDARFVTQVDFHDLQQGLIVTHSEVVIKRNPAFPDSRYPWIGICKVREVRKVVQRQKDLRVYTKIEAAFEKEESGNMFFATIRNLSAGGIYIESAEELHANEILCFRYCFEKQEREFRARAVWGKRLNSGRYGYGLQFLKLNAGAESEIRNYVFRLQNEKRKKQEQKH